MVCLDETRKGLFLYLFSCMIGENMEQQPKIKIGIQKRGGRLYEPSIALLSSCGYENEPLQYGQIKTATGNAWVYYLRDDDIPGLVARGKLDLGIVANHVVAESTQKVAVICTLKFGKWPLVLAVKQDSSFKCAQDLAERTIATSFTVVTNNFFQNLGIPIITSYWSGSVEAAIEIGDAEAITDISVTGRTIEVNGLRSIETIMYSQAVLIGNSEVFNKQTVLPEIADFLDKVKSVNLRTKYE